MDRYIQLEQGQASQFQIFGDGQQTRDFIYIEDVLTALDLVATKSEALGHVYNVGTEVAISLNQLIEEMNQLVGLSLPVSYQKERDGDIKYSLSDSSALKGLGFSPVYSIQEGLQNILSLPIIPKIDKKDETYLLSLAFLCKYFAQWQSEERAS